MCVSFFWDWQPANTKTCTQGRQQAVDSSACILLTGVVSEFDRKEIGAARPLPAFQKGQLQPIQIILLSAAGEPWHWTWNGPQDRTVHRAGTGCGLAGRFWQVLYSHSRMLCSQASWIWFAIQVLQTEGENKLCSLNRRISTRGWQNGTNEPPVEISQQAEIFKYHFY